VERVRGTAELGVLVCARGAQQQASQQKQAGKRRNEECVRGDHGKNIAPKAGSRNNGPNAPPDDYLGPAFTSELQIGGKEPPTAAGAPPVTLGGRKKIRPKAAHTLHTCSPVLDRLF